MSEEEISPIRPRSVPLSHVEAAAPARSPATRSLPWIKVLAALAALALLAVVFLVVPGLVAPPAVTIAPSGAGKPLPGDSGPSADSDRPPPFEALLREQTREKAQQELSRFVELQIRLEQSMQVGVWGQTELDGAKALATRGDEQFVAEAFEASLASYRAAGDALAELIRTGEALLQEALENGARALDARDGSTALASFTSALAIDPGNGAASAGIARAKLVPEVLDLLREARNHELAGDFRAALDTYEKIQALDSLTHGLSTALATARAGVRDMEYRELLSDGFRAMDGERFEAARTAFNRALNLKPEDPVALGGLEQVAQQKDLATIRALRSSAEGFAAAEDWRRAIEDYDKVLALDGNIQFARSGRASAMEQERLGIALGNIIASPDKLSSTSLYGQAHDLLTSARTLEPRGPKLAGQIARVEDLLSTYGTPVPVTLRSDNRTEVTLSTVGRLGTFSEKQLSLRPGAYTIIGSRDGCRDVRESILVRPDMQPVEIRCEETF